MTNETLNAETILESMDMGMSTILTEAARITHKYSTSSMALGPFPERAAGYVGYV